MHTEGCGCSLSHHRLVSVIDSTKKRIAKELN